MSAAENLRERRARAACAAVDAWRGTPSSSVPGLPVLVRSLGLAATVAYLYAHGDEGLATNLVDWLTRDHPQPPMASRGGVPGFLRDYTRLSSTQARLLEEEALAFAAALKLFSGGLHGR